MYHLAKILPKLITVDAFSPGFIPTTDLSRGSGFLGNIFMKWILPLFPFTRSLDFGAEAYLQLILDPKLLGVSGRYFADHQERQSSVESLDEAKQRICWEWSCKATGIANYGQ